ncbi:hypothetical protein AB0J84_07640 [Micromonospora arborensis]|uniref:hypothetical protein n=1 Tax=Micromonospora arborensis TaxID=2116518 RepID=UPI0034419B04
MSANPHLSASIAVRFGLGGPVDSVMDSGDATANHGSIANTGTFEIENHYHPSAEHAHPPAKQRHLPARGAMLALVLLLVLGVFGRSLWGGPEWLQGFVGSVSPDWAEPTLPRLYQAEARLVRDATARGLRHRIATMVEHAGSRLAVTDARNSGTEIDTAFTAKLTGKQANAVGALLAHGAGSWSPHPAPARPSWPAP